MPDNRSDKLAMKKVKCCHKLTMGGMRLIASAEMGASAFIK